MAQYRKKPVVVETVRWAGVGDTNRVMNWLAQQNANVGGWTFHDTDISIPTLEGTMKALPGDWIIRGVAGEFYPCRDNIFTVTYEPV